MQACHDCSQRNAPCPLNIVVEASNFWTVFIQDSFGVKQAEVLAAKSQNILLIPILNKKLTNGYKLEDSTCLLL